MIKIPPNYFWPGFVIALLSLSVTMSFGGLYFAQSDGGPQIIPDYYEKSVNYDDELQAHHDSRQLGWQLEVQLDELGGGLKLVDDSDEPVSDAEGTITFYRPDIAEPIAAVELNEHDQRPGVYQFENVTDRPGYWDLAVEMTRGEDAFVDSVRISVDG